MNSTKAPQKMRNMVVSLMQYPFLAPNGGVENNPSEGGLISFYLSAVRTKSVCFFTVNHGIDACNFIFSLDSETNGFFDSETND